MEYRTLPHGGEQISVIGLGISHIGGSRKEIAEIVSTAIDNGINYFDMIAPHKDVFYGYADAFEGRREKVMTQFHFGALYDNGEYGWGRDLAKIKQTFEWQMKLFNTHYTDMGFIHCIDEMEDFNTVMNSGLWDYMKGLKAEGRIRHLGFSSHNPEVAKCIIDTGLIDMMMFSINPAYDYRQGYFAIGDVEDRFALYRMCESMGIGISVMKTFCAGQLLDANISPFKQALTKTQCIQYALDRPGVMTVLPGVRFLTDLYEVLKYVNATAEEKDYTVISECVPQDTHGACMYCNHCQPCPGGLNVGLINKYYDLAKVGDQLAVTHYENLDMHASNCLQCGHCESRCPFHVKQESRMLEIAAYFGR